MTEYIINGVAYHPKEKYSLKVWGQILRILQSTPDQSVEQKVIALLGDDTLPKLLSLILDKPVKGELYEEDFATVNEVITDFFSRKTSLMNVSVSQSDG